MVTQLINSAINAISFEIRSALKVPTERVRQNRTYGSEQANNETAITILWSALGWLIWINRKGDILWPRSR
jgi:hypothetical protein